MKKSNKIYGIGINDYEYPINIASRDIQSYANWRNIFQRCYSEKSHIKHPTYKGCTICEEWILFSNFKNWHDSNYKIGFNLDKDILCENNKTYSPIHCRYVPPIINQILTDGGCSNHYLLPGVQIHKPNGKFRAKISKYGKSIHLGLFDYEYEAHECWRLAKIEYVKMIAESEYNKGTINIDVRDALLARNFKKLP